MKTIDNQEELFTVVNDKDEVIGYRMRGDCHGDKSLMHRAVSIVLYNKKGEILFQKRSRKKDLYPGYYTLSASGHVDEGESYEEAANREMKEELGIDIPIKYVGKIKVEYQTEKEMVAIFTGVSEGSFKINTDEIDSIEFMSREEVKDKEKKGILRLTPCAKKVLELI